MGSTVTLFIRARTGARKEDLRNSRVLCLVNLAIHYSLYLIRSLRSNSPNSTEKTVVCAACGSTVCDTTVNSGV